VCSNSGKLDEKIALDAACNSYIVFWGRKYDTLLMSFSRQRKGKATGKDHDASKECVADSCSGDDAAQPCFALVENDG
jgi:hypothetical protein